MMPNTLAPRSSAGGKLTQLRSSLESDRTFHRHAVVARFVLEEFFQRLETIHAEARDELFDLGAAVAVDGIDRHPQRDVPIRRVHAIEVRVQRDEQQDQQQDKDAEFAPHAATLPAGRGRPKGAKSQFADSTRKSVSSPPSAL